MRRLIQVPGITSRITSRTTPRTFNRMNSSVNQKKKNDDKKSSDTSCDESEIVLSPVHGTWNPINIWYGFFHKESKDSDIIVHHDSKISTKIETPSYDADSGDSDGGGCSGD
jgi:DUF4097 and DUF4098 domain-containing protein YvlB